MDDESSSVAGRTRDLSWGDAKARALLHDARDLQERTGRSDLAGPIAVGCYDTLAATILPRLVRGFSDLHPDVRIEATDGSQQAIQHRLDGGALDDPAVPPPGLSSPLLRTTMTVAIASATSATRAPISARLRVLPLAGGGAG